MAAKTQLSVSLAASTLAPNVGVRIRTSGAAARGRRPHATRTGTRRRRSSRGLRARSQVGQYRVTFTASTDAPAGAAQRTIVIHVGRANKPPPGPANPPGVYPQSTVLSDRATETYRWAFVRRHTVARSGPSRGGAGCVQDLLSDAGALPERDPDAGQRHVRQRLDVDPDQALEAAERVDRLGAAWHARRFQTVHTRMTISHARMRATLYKRGRVIFSDDGRRRAVALADAARRVLHPREALRLLRAGVRAARLRAERALDGADRLARRRVHRHPRHERAADPSGPRLARLRANATPRSCGSSG